MTTTHELVTERVPCASLTPYPGNPRRGDVSAIAESLKTHGQYRPLVAQRSTSRILGGNHSWTAAVSLGWTEIDVIFLDVDDDQAKRIVLADNRLSDLAGYSTDDLAALLTTLDDLVGTGYTPEDLAAMSPELPEGFDELDPDAPARTKTVTCPECGTEFEL